MIGARRRTLAPPQFLFSKTLSHIRRVASRYSVSTGHYENFPVASFLLPHDVRNAVLAIYRFARAADDIADEGDATHEERLAALDRFEHALDAIAAGRPPADAPFADLAVAVERHALPLELFRHLLSAFRQDVTTPRYATWGALQSYCRRSADPIGRLLLRIHRRDCPDNAARSDAICTALQLVNFWQDIALDWKKGRVYLPQEDLAHFDVTETQIADGRADERWCALIAFETARTRGLLESGRPLLRSLPWRFALELSGVLAGGHRILDRIDAVRGDIFRRRPSLGRVDWAIVAWHALAPPRRHRLASPGLAS